MKTYSELTEEQQLLAKEQLLQESARLLLEGFIEPPQGWDNVILETIQVSYDQHKNFAVSCQRILECECLRYYLDRYVEALSQAAYYPEDTDVVLRGDLL